MEDGGWLYGQRSRIDLHELAQSIEQRSGDSDSDLDSIVISDIAQRSVDLPAQVPRDPVRSLSSVQVALLDGQLVREGVELCLQSLGDERLVEAWPQVIHDPETRW